MKGKPTHQRVVLNNPHAVRTLDEVREELERRTGIRISRQRVWALTRSAELKIAKALAQ